MFCPAQVNDIVLLIDDVAVVKLTSSIFQQVIFDEDVPRRVRCVVRGGYPPPLVHILFDNFDITDRFSLDYSNTIHGEPGLRTFMYNTSWFNDDVVVSAVDDGSIMQCTVNVPGLAPTGVQVKVVVNCG